MNEGKKDLAEGALAVGAAGLAIANPVAGVMAAAAPSLLKAVFRRFEHRRAEKLFTRMVEADESPEEFGEHLRSKIAEEHDETMAALRLLVTASLEAVTAAAVEPIAMVGRQYLRGVCPSWIARGWVRVLMEFDERELGQLRDLVAAGRLSPAHLPIEFRLEPGLRDHDPAHLSLEHVVISRHPGAVASGDARRFVELFVQNHLAHTVDEKDQTPPAVRGAFQRGRDRVLVKIERASFRVIDLALPPSTI